MLVQQLGIQVRRDLSLTAVAGMLDAQQLPVLDDIRPIVAARIVDEHQHLAAARKGLQGLQGLLGHGADAENHNATRQPGRAFGQCGQCFQKAMVHLGAAGLALLPGHIVLNPAPQHRLPGLAVRQGADLAPGIAQTIPPLGPLVKPIGAVHLVLVVQVSQMAGQLIALAQVVIVGQKALQGGESVIFHYTWQEFQQPPGQALLVIGRFVRGLRFAQNGAVGAPQEAGRQLKIDRRADAAAVVGGHGQLEPLGHAVALDEENLVFQRLERVAADPSHRHLPQVFQMVGVNDRQSGPQRPFTISGPDGHLYLRRNRSVAAFSPDRSPPDLAVDGVGERSFSVCQPVPKSLRPKALRKVLRRLIPGRITWCKAPGASILAGLGMLKTGN